MFFIHTDQIHFHIFVCSIFMFTFEDFSDLILKIEFFCP